MNSIIVKFPMVNAHCLTAATSARQLPYLCRPAPQASVLLTKVKWTGFCRPKTLLFSGIYSAEIN